MPFHFQLKPIESISAWGDNPPTLHWYGLTDGWFWIEAGGQELFRYSDAVIPHWQREYDTPISPLPYEEYQVARYFEDLMQMLYAVLDPIPDDLAAIVADAERWETWQKNARQQQESNNGDDDTEWGMYYTAVGWWGERQWSASHLNYPPRIWLWRHRGTVHLRWDNRNTVVDGIPVWAAVAGQVTLSFDEFLAAVKSYNDAFLAAMQERIEIIRVTNPRPDVAIDLNSVERDHAYHAGLLPDILTERPREIYSGITWEETRAAIERIECEMVLR